MYRLRSLFFCLLLVLISATSLSAQTDDSEAPVTEELTGPTSIYPDISQFGGPTSVGGQLAEDAAVAPEYRFQRLQDRFQPWYGFKERLNTEKGLQFGINETIFYQVATEAPGKNDGATGVFELLGQWELLGKGTDHSGQIVFKAEDRHRIGPLTPFDLGFAAGSIVPTATKFNEFSFSVTNLFWKQTFQEGRIAFVVGRVDVTDFVDVYALMNPLTQFTNLAFSTNPTIAAPNQGLGIAAGGMLTEHLYMQGGFSDANGQSTQAGFDTFFDDSEYFSYLELGVTSSHDRIYLDNIHVTLWQTDAREIAGTPYSQGVAFTVQQFLCDTWLPFFRFGYSDGDASLMSTTFSTGLGLKRKNKDVAGIGFSWGKPASGTVQNQFTSEAFYRFQLTQFFAVTPDVQLIVDPALNPNVDVLALFGVRVRLAF